MLCQKFSLDPLADGVILSHREGALRGIATNHGDLEHLWSKFGLTMDQFRKDVAAKLKKPRQLSDRQKVQQAAGLTDSTMDFLECYKYANDLLRKLAAAMK